MKQRLVWRTCLSVVLGLCTCATTGRGQDGGAKKVDDQTFVKKVSAVDLVGTELGNLAAQRAMHDEVRRFAETTMAYHGKSGAKLAALAEKAGLAVSTTANKKHTELQRKLADLKGVEFDRQYLSAVVKLHKEALKLFEGQSRHGANTDLRKHAADVLPVLREQLRAAQEIGKKYGAKGGG
jgi:predicted outer membrane protein